MERPGSSSPVRWLAGASVLLAISMLLVALPSCGSDRPVGYGTPSSPSSSPPPSSVAPTPVSTGMNPTEAAALVPLAPLSVTAQVEGTGVHLTWPGTGQDDVHYLVYRKHAGAQDWSQLATLAISGDNRGSYAFSDTTGERGTTYVYGVGAVSTFGRQSAITQSDPVTIPTS